MTTTFLSKLNKKLCKTAKRKNSTKWFPLNEVSKARKKSTHHSSKKRKIRLSVKFFFLHQKISYKFEKTNGK